MGKIKNFIKNNIPLLILSGFLAVYLFVALRLYIFKFNNFDFGKFDQGNMTQMVWNTLRGRILYLTDYFGSNVPRWSMSHVDPILLLFVPVFALFQHPMTVAYAQLVLIVLSAFIVYAIANMELKSRWASCAFAISYLLYPALGFINSTMGFHGVTAAVPFFLGAFYVFEKMYKRGFTSKGIIVLSILLIITMSGKEQIPLYVFMWGLFILVFRNGVADAFKFTKEWFRKWILTVNTKIGLGMVISGIIWFCIAFFVIIPKYAPLRTESYNRFLKSLNVDVNSSANVTLENYFLGRYENFGSSYKDVIINMVLNHRKVIRVFFGTDKLGNLSMTFTPLLYIPLLNPSMLLISAPDFLINYLTTEEGLGTSEIQSHRISMIIPILIISSIYAVGFISRSLSQLIKNQKVSKNAARVFIILFSSAIAVSCLVTSKYYDNPIYLWFTQAVMRRVQAKYDVDIIKRTDLKLGDVVKLKDIDVRDVKCANAIISQIPDGVSVSGPDNLGAHLSMRETYALYPALWNEADYVILDVLSRKITLLLMLDSNIVSEVGKFLITSRDHTLVMACGNLFLFKKDTVANPNAVDIYPIQERFMYKEKFNYPLSELMSVVDYTLPERVVRGVDDKATVVYQRSDLGSLNGYMLYTTYVNSKTGEMYQVANLPSFAFYRPEGWEKGYYYVENVDIVLPSYVEAGNYKVFVSLTNRIRYVSMYLGDLKVD